VKVIHGLPPILSRVDHRAVSAGQPFLTRDLCRYQMEMAQQGTVFGGGMFNRSQVCARNNQHVNGRLRIDIREGVALLILVDGLRGNASIDDSAE